MALALVLAALLPGLVLATDPMLQAMQGISDTDHIAVQPERLGRPLQLLIKTPPAEDDNTLFPTVYLLDGGALFPMLAGYYNYLRHEDAVPPMILVALSYGSDTFEGGNYRSTDYTAPSTERDYWGGAANFQQVLKEDVIPLIESRYPSDPGQRILFGQSIGGQFVLFSALTEPDLFYGRIASNPALHRNLEFFLETKPEKGTTRLFVSSGSEDFAEFREPALTWMAHWEKQDTSLNIRGVTLNGYGHFSIAPESFRQGIRWIFAD